jgi:Flp pilus assembly protein TadD
MTDPQQQFERAVQAFNQRKFRQALELALTLLPQAPDHAELNYLAGMSAMELQQMNPALEHLHRAAKLQPARADYVTQFAKALSLVNMSADAAKIATHAMTLSPLDAQALDTLGVVFTRANAHEHATRLYERAAATSPDVPAFRYNLAKSLVFLGRMDDAERELETCLTRSPGTWGAHLTLSQLRRQTPERNHLGRLHALLSENASSPAAQLNLHLALAKEYEDLADYPTALRHLVAGKSAGASMRPYTPQRDQDLFDQIIRHSPRPQPASAGCDSSEPIFIVGMPRSGTTLVERILSSHPDVHAAGELQNFALACKRVSGSPTQDLLDAETVARASHLDWRRLGQDYLDSTRPDTSLKPHFIDKLPHNFLYLGAIANALPNAKIICLRRDPMDTCLSNFRQLFGTMSWNHDYSYDLLNTGRYYILFDRLMAHWKQQFPGRILEVQYEALVESQEVGSRELVAFCGLPWHDACLHFEDNQAPATTASAVQVREPIYRRAIQRWKAYGDGLDALQDLLRAGGIQLPT